MKKVLNLLRKCIRDQVQSHSQFYKEKDYKCVQFLYRHPIKLKNVTKKLFPEVKCTLREGKERFDAKSTDYSFCFRARREAMKVVNRLSLRATVKNNFTGKF